MSMILRMRDVSVVARRTISLIAMSLTTPLHHIGCKAGIVGHVIQTGEMVLAPH